MSLAKRVMNLVGMIGRLTGRVERLERAIGAADFRIRAVSSSALVNRAGNAQDAAPGAPQNGSPGYFWAKVGDQTVETGLYSAKLQLPNGFGVWIDDPRYSGNIIVCMPDLKSLETGALVPVRWEGMGQDGRHWWTVLAPSSGGVSMYRVKTVYDDYLKCRSWDGTTEGSTDVYVAKPWELRKSSFHNLTIDGVTYVSTGTQSRTATKAPWIEQQIIFPSYRSPSGDFKGEQIAALSCSTGVKTSGNVPINLLDISTRMWAEALP